MRGDSLQSVESLLALMSIKSIGPTTAVRLARAFETWDALLTSSPSERVAVAGKAGASVQSRPESPGVTELAGARVVGHFDADFPDALRAAPQAPAVIWIRGTVGDKPGIAVVGTREPTAAGLAASATLARWSVLAGYAVISGLAEGVDFAAHEACLDAGGKTVAVLGAGLDVLGPTDHMELAERILAAGGGLVSEVRPGVKASGRTLVPRNRLQVALSDAVLVAQTDLEGGTLTTAEQALKQGRPLACWGPEAGDEPQAWAGNAAMLNPKGFHLLKAPLRKALETAGPARLVNASVAIDHKTLAAWASRDARMDPSRESQP